MLEQFVYAPVPRERDPRAGRTQRSTNLKEASSTGTRSASVAYREIRRGDGGTDRHRSPRANASCRSCRRSSRRSSPSTSRPCQEGAEAVAAKALLRYGAANDYVGAWVVQRTLGGHAVPADAPTLRCARGLACIDSDGEEIEAVRRALGTPRAQGEERGVHRRHQRHGGACCWEDEPNCPACPLKAECPVGQEMVADAMTASRTARAKPR